MTDETVRECYGFAVECVADSDARGVVDEFFGSEVAERPVQPVGAAPTVQLTIKVTDDAKGPTVNPPHTVEVMKSDPISIDTGSSSAVVDPRNWSTRITLARRDIDDPVVWGHWLMERMFLYLVCRSPRHYPLHAGAISVDGRAAVLAGPTGMGKSTFSYWAQRRGANLISEDIMVRHLDDKPGRVWGYPHAAYLDREVFERFPEPVEVRRTAYNDGERFRVSLADLSQQRLQSAAQPDCFIFLARGATALRELDVDEAARRCWDDFSTAKDNEAVVAEVAADLRRGLVDLPIWELAVADDLETGYGLLCDALSSL